MNFYKSSIYVKDMTSLGGKDSEDSLILFYQNYIAFPSLANTLCWLMYAQLNQQDLTTDAFLRTFNIVRTETPVGIDFSICQRRCSN